ncbi:hypothetical protein BN946_scf184989.g11 [Trametes cinnabarina]|uniref:Uncharacterized protein n=1 Tax=Pycnoporus cinnabarinus TaxID=5643 RepID=A0A060S352_PYCCI|nr:hypothetical protein BN946_scf184989.g11 [Trametes cinnabarina]
MAAAVFLHNAIFTNDPSAPPASIGHRVSIGSASTGHGRSSNHRRAPHMRQLSSVSFVTLQTSTSEHSHPTEPLIHAGSSESSVYLDLLARQPTHPSSPPPARGTGLTLQGDPVTQRERRNVWERAVRRRLKILRWVGRGLTVILCGWAVYNTVRYFVGAMLYQYRDRQIVAIVLGSCAALSIACVLVSIIIDASAPQLGWYYKPRSAHVLLLDFLNYSSSFCLLAPAIVNFALVFVWRTPSDTLNGLPGRCHWDIDVVWSGLGGQCASSPAWGYWFAGSLVRLILTALIIIAHHAVSYKYMVTRQPSRRRHTSIFRHSTASFPTASMRTSASSRSFHAMTTASSTTAPVSASTDGGGSSGQPSPMRERAASLNTNNTEPRTLRSSRSRIMAQDVSPLGSKVIRRAVSANALRPAPRQEPLRDTSPSSSDEDLAEIASEDRYGQPLRQSSSTYASIPLSSPSRAGSSTSAAGGPVPDSELNTFAAEFRALVEQVSRETDEAVAYAQQDRYESAGYYSGDDREEERMAAARVVVGRTIHRMPTIESLGSHEMMSLASRSRSNTLSNYGDAPTSRSASRANSLDAAVSLSLSVDGPGAVGEMGELTPNSTTSLNGATLLGSRSTGSYHTAMSSVRTESAEE